METGLSDFHHLIYTIFKSTYSKLPHVLCSFRSYKKFNEEDFRQQLNHQLNLFENVTFNNFNNTSSSLINTFATLKRKTIRGKHKPFISKSLKKEMMKTAHLKNIANNFGLESDLYAYKRQRNLVVSLNKKSKKKLSFLALK